MTELSKVPTPLALVPVPAPAPPVRQYSFTDFQVNNPTASPPGDRMDAEYDRVKTSISQLIDWVERSLAQPAVTAATSNDDNSASYFAALAQDYADVTQAWAEHMPDTIPPNILAVMNITGDHWSSRWWAHQAAITFGSRQKLQNLLYRATANQTVFPLTAPDLAGNTYAIVSTEPLDVFVNGVRLPPDDPNPGNGDWVLDAAGSTVTFLTPLLAGSMVQIDVLSPNLSGLGDLLGGPFLPLSGNATVTGPVTFNPAPPSTADGAADYDFMHQTPAVSSPANSLHFVTRVILEPGAGDATRYWAIGARARTSSTYQTANLVGGYFQSWRLPGSMAPIWGGITEASDFTGLNSSAVGAATSSMEMDLGTTGLDDATNPSMFGGIGNRHLVHFVATRNQGTDENEVSTGLWFGTNQTRMNSVIGFSLNSRFYQALDTRGAVVPLTVTDPLCSVRMSVGQIIDFNGGASLTSPPGSYFQYTVAGPDRLRWMSGGVELLSIEDTGDFLLYGNVGIDAAIASGVQVEIGGANTVGIRTSGAFTTSLRMLSDQRLSFNTTDGSYLQYRAATGRLYCVMAGVDAWSVDAVGNIRARGTFTPSTTP